MCDGVGRETAPAGDRPDRTGTGWEPRSYMEEIRCREPHGVGVVRRTVRAPRGDGGQAGYAVAALSPDRCSWSGGGSAGARRPVPRSSWPTPAPTQTSTVPAVPG